MDRASSDVMRTDRFNGENFKRWQSKVKFWLTSLNVFWVISDPPPGPEVEQAAARRVEANQSALGRILAVLADQLYDVYMHFVDAKELWEALDKKYAVSDAGKELYLVEKFEDYKMVDGRSVVEQAHEIQLMISELGQYNCAIPSQFQAGSIIAKLPPSWRDFATILKHRREIMSVEDLIASLDVEEKSSAKDGARETQQVQAKANLVEQGTTSKPKNKKKKKKKKKKKNKNKKSQTPTPEPANQKRKKVVDCWVCGELGDRTVSSGGQITQ